VWASETTGAETVLAKQSLDKPGCAGLSISACDMDDSVNLLRVTEQLNQTARWV
jgi:hypothetical protein